jgi:hypothetical protein
MSFLVEQQIRLAPLMPTDSTSYLECMYTVQERSLHDRRVKYTIIASSMLTKSVTLVHDKDANTWHVHSMDADDNRSYHIPVKVCLV